MTLGHGARPSVILILADDMGVGDLPCASHPLVACDAPSFGHPYAELPALSQLAKEGTRFLQAYTVGLTCGPSRAALLSGRFPANMPSHVNNRSLHAHASLAATMPVVTEVLRRSGYMTAHFGKCADRM